MKLTTRLALPLAIGALALTGCGTPDSPTDDTSKPPATASPAPSKTATPSTPSTHTAPAAEPTTPPAKPAAATATPAAVAGVTLDTSSTPWDTTTQDPGLLAAHGLIADVYYTVKGDGRGWGGTMCAQTRPTLCTEWPDREALMDEALGGGAPAEGVTTPSEAAAPPLREQDPYAGLSDEELAELPVTGAP